MTDVQQAVDAIRDAMKGDWMLTVWYRSEHGRAIKRKYESADVLKALADKFESGLTPIDSLYSEITVGTTPESEEKTGGYHE